MTLTEQQELDIIQSWLRNTTELYDNWEWDGDELVILLDGKVIERYNRDTVLQVITKEQP